MVGGLYLDSQHPGTEPTFNGDIYGWESQRSPGLEEILQPNHAAAGPLARSDHLQVTPLLPHGVDASEPADPSLPPPAGTVRSNKGAQATVPDRTRKKREEKRAGRKKPLDKSDPIPVSTSELGTACCKC
jgi:hypothetical protein